ncbi:hypothetical protein OB915_19575 [Klebsiella pneumoniae]|nr:hypothetical protein [Klebsiella pneumoniae]
MRDSQVILQASQVCGTHYLLLLSLVLVYPMFFKKKDITNGISDFFFIACIMFFILHLILAWGAKYLDKKDDSTIELGELTKEYNNRVSEIEIIRERMVQEDKLSTTQKLVIYLTTLQVNSHIRKILIANKEKKLTLADFPIDTESFFFDCSRLFIQKQRNSI